MKNSEQPITPTTLRQVGDFEYRIATSRDVMESKFLTSYFGLTKREYFAALAMQGLLSNPEWMHKDGNFKMLNDEFDVAVVSVGMADAVLKELDNENNR
jgi:hypothetical protein